MDAGIADTINRQAARLVALRFDGLDELWDQPVHGGPWYLSPIADTFMGDNDATNADRAWLFGGLAARTPGLDFDGEPADCDWENLFANFRAEILARRDPETPSVRGQSPARDGVGSR